MIGNYKIIDTNESFRLIERKHLQKININVNIKSLSNETLKIAACISGNPQIISITSDPFNKSTIFLSEDAASVHLSTDLRKIYGLSPRTIDLDSVAASLMGDENYSFRTIWKGLFSLPPGGTIKISRIRNNANNEPEFEYPCLRESNTRIDIADSFLKTLQDYSHGHELVMVNFSGGTDSSAILYGLMEFRDPKNIVAVTWHATNSSSPHDVEHAKSITNALGVRHVVSTIAPDELVSLTPSSFIRPLPSTATAFDNFYERTILDMLAETECSTVGVFDGHGGDHLFLDPPPSEILRQILKKYGPRTALRKLDHLAKLTNIGTPMLVFSGILSRRKTLHPQDSSLFSTELKNLANTSKKRNTPSDDIHERWILSAIYQNSFQSNHLPISNIYFPFTSRKMIDAARSWPNHEFFDGTRRRIPFRSSIQARFPDIQFRSEKGDITAAHQRSILKNLTEIQSTIENGYLSKLEYINRDAVARHMNHAATGVNGISAALLRLISFEKTLLQFT
ncbi:asparagine synthase-related protein [Burkholderia perseverans]|uniref:asparagine synthase-related protein n=1 Tax=Burkholderia perseverans TaxID=2615214 RepID=UPI001FEE0E7D|nr:asparagine synthase-related protein [Burkholderia perseverans]